MKAIRKFAGIWSIWEVLRIMAVVLSPSAFIWALYAYDVTHPVEQQIVAPSNVEPSDVARSMPMMLSWGPDPVAKTMRVKGRAFLSNAPGEKGANITMACENRTQGAPFRVRDDGSIVIMQAEWLCKAVLEIGK